MQVRIVHYLEYTLQCRICLPVFFLAMEARWKRLSRLTPQSRSTSGYEKEASILSQ